MRMLTTTIGTVVLAVWLVCPAGAAESRFKWHDPRDWGPPGGFRTYDPKTVETVKGTVLDVEQLPARDGDGYQVRLRIQTATELLPVHLGPDWFVNEQPVKLAPKDEVEVKGSRIRFKKKPEILAAEVRKGTATMVLRDATGAPAWANRQLPP